MSLKPFAFAMPLLPFSLFAQSLPGVHEHGFGRLSLALDQQQLVLELLAPAADIVGFEHLPADDTEQAQLTAALSRVQQAEMLFSLPETAACRLIDSQLVEEGAHSHELDEHEQTDHHDHAHEAADEHEHHEDEDGHNDVLVQYRYQCQQPQALNSLSTTLFEQFPSLTRVELQGIVPSGQIASTLTPNQPAFSW
ncbi:DUF2796 domain-containing protein [Oceanisphaera arctica]|uniref:Zinc-binding protein n=1 Tax=Oceanisphaera arctica TaxID=641510 RepID=A0A2P5TIL9_9GAMM|nr:DUF2796 domain-containing protein [Oceanisphaera arctica]PPL14614.1 hypothetical protein UN63_15250 [Oceanisphaera arctica]GHA10032.1 hypothetical protein GCM10007082_08880 [Oceanisphaera arctica]